MDVELRKLPVTFAQTMHSGARPARGWSGSASSLAGYLWLRPSGRKDATAVATPLPHRIGRVRCGSAGESNCANSPDMPLRSTLDGVSVTLDLPEDVLTRLRTEAERRGTTLDELIAALADQFPTDATATRRPLAFVGAGASAGGITPRIEQLLAEGFGRD